MGSLSFAIVGDASIASALGKFSSKTDITMYDQKTADTIVTYYIASSYPEKMQSLVQALAMADCPILSISKLDKTIGEQIVAIDSFHFDHGFIFCAQEVSIDNLKMIIKGTSLEKFIFVENVDALKSEIAKMEQKGAGTGAADEKTSDGKTRIIVDQAFNVKGVGTVVLGAVKSGIVKVHDALELLPAQKEVTIKSIQMHDNDVQEAPTGSRVGLSIKGAVADELSRGDVMAAKGSMSFSKEFSIKFEKCRFYKGEIKADAQYHLAVGAKINPARVKFEGAEGKNAANLKIISEKPFAYSKDENCILLDMNSQTLRLAGSGKII